MAIAVRLILETGTHRQAVLERLRDFLPVPDGQLIEDGEDVRVSVPTDDENLATERAKAIVRGALDGTDIAVPEMLPLGSWPGA